MGKPLVFLDLDGVVNAFPSQKLKERYDYRFIEVFSPVSGSRSRSTTGPGWLLGSMRCPAWQTSVG